MRNGHIVCFFLFFTVRKHRNFYFFVGGLNFMNSISPS